MRAQEEQGLMFQLRVSSACERAWPHESLAADQHNEASAQRVWHTAPRTCERNDQLAQTTWTRACDPGASALWRMLNAARSFQELTIECAWRAGMRALF